ncbi:amidohydrolase [Govanella unica]|uniref:Amidohydrolase n=1 Tax=Govanella unica TaxID=2975056 RepID=A0A9X3Z7E5_9PROT|nr:amidohydrolase [Govania unica]MDA5193983.1 amidohydrolase [Govania unica]
MAFRYGHNLAQYWAIPLAFIISGCAATATEPVKPSVTAGVADTFPSTYRPLPSHETVIVNAIILDGQGQRIENGKLHLRDGKLVAIGRDIAVPETAQVIDAKGRWITPGIIDIHTHLGTATTPYTPVELKTWDVNETTDPNTAHVRAEHSVHTQDPGFALALAGGVTTVQVLPGSSNLVGGQSAILKTIPATTVQAMKFPNAPRGIKMACGENPKYTYGGTNRAPGSRMGIVAGFRQIFDAAADYRRKEDAADGSKKAPRDLKLETLAAVLRGDVQVHIHCYRSDDMAALIDLSKDYGFKIAAFHHATDAYKISDLLVKNNICAAVWSDWWGFKMEALDGIRENAAFIEAAGGCAMMHSDSAIIGQRLTIEAAKAMGAGKRAGIDIPREVAIRWVTSNPARAMGMADRIGSLEPGKNADLVLWSGDPFSIYSKPDLVFVDGAIAYDRKDRTHQPGSDFSVGQQVEGARP